MAWVYLFIAGLLECAWAIGLKYSDGLTKPLPSVLTLLAVIASLWLLAIAMKTIPIGTAYAIWTGIGTTGVALPGILLLNEPRDLARLICITLIVSGVIGLKLFSTQHG